MCRYDAPTYQFELHFFVSIFSATKKGIKEKKYASFGLLLAIEILKCLFVVSTTCTCAWTLLVTKEDKMQNVNPRIC